MDFAAFYAAEDAERLSATLRRLAEHDISRWAMTGGTAIELWLRQMGSPPCLRPLHDVDFIAASFDCLSPTLGGVLLARHVHPHDPPGKTMLQAVDPETSVRVDVFRAYGCEMQRTQSIELYGAPLKIVSFADLVCRHARLCCDLFRDQPVAPKFARDFLRMVRLATPEHLDEVWREHRKTGDPATFVETADRLRETIAVRPDLLIPAAYSTDIHERCLRCESTAAFRLADAKHVVAILGYC